MTPFDPWALLAMLLAFYPTPSAAALRQARAERPEYFAGGLIIGSKGDKLELPDGRVWDLIYAAGGLPGDQRWQVLEVTGDAGGDGWGLEPGPLTPIDTTVFPASGAVPVLERLWGQTWAALGNPDAGILRMRADVASIADTAPLEASYAADVGGAAGAVDQQLAALWQIDPWSVIRATGEQGDTIGNEREQYPDPGAEPPDVPPHDAGPIPHPEPEPGEPNEPRPNPM